MPTVGLVGSDTIKLNDRIFNDLMDQDVGALTYPNDVTATKTGKNGNSVIALNKTGDIAELTLRIVRGSSDDKYLNSQLQSMVNNFPGYVAMSGEVVKNIGDGAGNITQDKYLCSFGVVSKRPEMKSNVEGDTEQGVAIWMIRFTNAPRAIT